MTGSAPLSALDAVTLRRWCRAGCAALGRARAEIDALNVFPVPDGDTGTNLLLTMQAVVDGLAVRADEPEQSDPGPGDLPATMRLVAESALRGARGSSGVILSQILRGFSDVLAGCPTAGGGDLQRALTRGADAAYAAVARPREGTVLSVARAAAKAAADADPADLAAVVAAAAGAARTELARTPSLLPQLAAAGVVDAGGRGLVVLLDALLAVVTGAPDPADVVAPVDPSALVAAREAGSDEFAYEVEFLLDAKDTEVVVLRQRLAALGDALVIVGGDGLHHVHVHVNDVGAALEAGVEAGRPHRISVVRFADQTAAAAPVAAASRVVAIAPAGGLARLFRSAGAVVVEGGRGESPTTGQLRSAIESAGAPQVVVLPNSRDLRVLADAAATAARSAGRTVVVLPTRSPVQGLAALAVHDPDRRFDDDAVAMSAAAAATRYAEVTRAVRDAQTSAGRCRAGDVLGLIDDDVVLIGSDVTAVARGLLDRLLVSGGELVTLVEGADAPAGLGDAVAAHVAAGSPAVETVVVAGGQQHYPLLIGVE